MYLKRRTFLFRCRHKRFQGKRMTSVMKVSRFTFTGEQRRQMSKPFDRANFESHQGRTM
jgi:hypothetical protein